MRSGRLFRFRWFAVLLLGGIGVGWWGFHFIRSPSVNGIESSGPPKTRRPPKPDGPWRREFEELWTERGRTHGADHPWFFRRTVVVMGDGTVPRSVLEETRGHLEEALIEMGLDNFKTQVELQSWPEAFNASLKEGLLNYRVFSEAVARWRKTAPTFRGVVAVFVTQSAIQNTGRKQKAFRIQTSRGYSPWLTTFPPSGVASPVHGTAVISEYWMTHMEGITENLPTHPREAQASDRRTYTKTARHELYHVFGLPHHDALPDPGFGDPPFCTECHETRPSHRGNPHPECDMICGGSSQDYRAHYLQHGVSIGLCLKCRTAVRALAAGVTGP